MCSALQSSTLHTPNMERLLTPLILTSIVVLLPSPSLSQSPLYTWCMPFSSDNYTTNSTFQTNLHGLLSNLTKTTPSSSGYLDTTSGSAPDRVYGLALCRGDTDASTCRSCLNLSSIDLPQTCTHNMDAMVWYDNCLVRYSDRRFAGTANNGNKFYMRNGKDVLASDAVKFNATVVALLEGLRTYAVNNATSPALFAAGRMALGGFEGYDTLYGLVQCTRDIGAGDCDQCLQGIFTFLPNCCSNRIGGRVLTASCNFRYEVYSFYNWPRAITVPPVGEAAPAPQPVPAAELPRFNAGSPAPVGLTSNGDGSLASGNKKNQTGIVLAIAIPSGLAILIFILISCIYFRKKDKIKTQIHGPLQGIAMIESFQFDFITIRLATNNFSPLNKLGEGGFGAVYKGVLPDGQEIAVKRILTVSGEGVEQLKNEVALLAKLQHRNLVRILGVCFEGEEKLLIFEYIANTSMDTILFDPIRKEQLNWEVRYKIIMGIARGLQYLHEESQIRIIHRDLKASNILLDGELSPKIADFGTARLFGGDQTQANTNTVIGTFGYMPPEYVMRGQFSAKTDVFSFGVLVLEIVSGCKSSNFSNFDSGDLSFVWNHWSTGSISDIVDRSLRGNYQQTEAQRCIQIGLLCVQELPNDRPTMSSIVLMLNSHSISIHVPQQPTYLSNYGKMLQHSQASSLSGQSNAKSGNVTPNEASITELDPR